MDTLLNPGHIALWLLVVGLFFPRLGLFFAWLGTGTYPSNPLPDVANLLLWLLFPRFLMAYYIAIDIGTANFWFWAYIVTGIVGFFGESGFVRRRTVRRTTVTRDGDRTTTITEEDV